MHNICQMNMEVINRHWHSSPQYNDWDSSPSSFQTISVESYYPVHNNAVNNVNSNNSLCNDSYIGNVTSLSSF
ncbi:UNVERIFIED_CONTAM: hypothetical protein RMT77_013360 [Armadillidium vulgare]